MTAALDVERLKVGVDLVDLVGRRVKLTREGRVFWGQCPFHKEKSPSFKVENERARYHCFGCGAHGDAVDWLQKMEGLTFIEAVNRLSGGAAPRVRNGLEATSEIPTLKTPDDSDRIGRARALWKRRKSATGSLTEVYLRFRRGYSGAIPATIGFLPPSKPHHHPAMMAAIGIASESEPGVLSIEAADVRAVHLTLLKSDGSGKADMRPNKIMIGAVKGSPIVLAVPNDSLGLAITEGIEDGLSVHRATGLGVWAAGSAGFMPGLAVVVPGYIDALSIYAHPDEAGQRCAHQLVEHLRARQHKADIAVLDLGGDA